MNRLGQSLLMGTIVLGAINPLTGYADQNNFVSEIDSSKVVNQVNNNKETNLMESKKENNNVEQEGLASSKNGDNKETKTNDVITQTIPWNDTGLNLTLDADGTTLHVPGGNIVNKNVSIGAALISSGLVGWTGKNNIKKLLLMDH